MKKKLLTVFLSASILCVSSISSVMAADRVEAVSSNSSEAVSESDSNADSIETSESLSDIYVADQNTEKVSSGIVQIQVGYTMDDDSFDIWKTSIGFAINDSTVITADGCESIGSSDLEKNKSEKKDGYKVLGYDLDAQDILSKLSDRLTIKVYDGSSLISCEKLDTGDTEVLFTILHCERPVDSYAVMASEEPEYDMEAYAIGYVKDVMDGWTYATDADELTQSIEITGVTATGEVGYTNKSTETFLGGPIVDTDGHILGITSAVEDSQGTAISNKRIQVALDELDLDYEVKDPVEHVDVDNLVELVKKAKDIDTSVYGDIEEVSDLNNALSTGENVLSDGDRTQEQVDNANDELSDAIDNISTASPQKGIPVVLIVVIAAIATAALVFLFLRKFFNNKDQIEMEKYGFESKASKIEKKKENQKKKEPKKGETVKKASKKNTPDAITDKLLMPKAGKKQTKNNHNIVRNEDGICEEMLTIKDDSYEDYEEATDVLRIDPSVTATIKRANTGEAYTITKARTTLGKDRTAADIYIPGNRTISRIHCEILYVDKKYKIRDLDSTNHTYLNGRVLKPNLLNELEDGMSIGLSNEDFIVHIH